jgi:hypothetical protein
MYRSLLRDQKIAATDFGFWGFPGTKSPKGLMEQMAQQGHANNWMGAQGSGDS